MELTVEKFREQALQFPMCRPLPWVSQETSDVRLGPSHVGSSAQAGSDVFPFVLDVEALGVRVEDQAPTVSICQNRPDGAPVQLSLHQGHPPLHALR
jgi:hypothetical protein